MGQSSPITPLPQPHASSIVLMPAQSANRCADGFPVSTHHPRPMRYALEKAKRSAEQQASLEGRSCRLSPTAVNRGDNEWLPAFHLVAKRKLAVQFLRHAWIIQAGQVSTGRQIGPRSASCSEQLLYILER